MHKRRHEEKKRKKTVMDFEKLMKGKLKKLRRSKRILKKEGR
jgi:hypothetical protein